MKKVCFTILSVMLLAFVPLFVGCGSSNAVENVMSERTSIYFAGNIEGTRASISVGERENPYIKDGKHQSTCGYSLICVDMAEYSTMKLAAVVNINGRDNRVDLELVSGTYMCDLEYKLKEDDKITLTFNEQTIEFTNVSKDFGINGDKAIEIAKECMAEKFKLYKDRQFECYLRILGEADGETGELFWCFTLIGSDGKSYSAIISVTDGNVIAND